MEGDIVEKEDLDQRLDKVRIYEKAILVVMEFEIIIRSKKKGILNVAYRQGLQFKRFKQPNKFVEMLQEIDISKLTVYFKVKLVKILEKYPKLKKSSLSLNFFKNYLKTIKEVFKESGNEFK